MKMITLFLPEKYLEMLDTLVVENLYPNRSEALRIATFKFLHESVDMLKAIPPRSASSVIAKKSDTNAIDSALAELGESPAKEVNHHSKSSTLSPRENADPFDELVGSIQAV